jgi:hypothetical protein
VRTACGGLQENVHLTATLSWQNFWARGTWVSPVTRTKYILENGLYKTSNISALFVATQATLTNFFGMMYQ